MTANLQEGEVSRYRSLGAAGVIGKPFDPMTLPRRSRRSSGGRRAVSDDLQEILAALRAGYAADLPAIVASLAASLDEARREPSAELLRAAREQAHRLHGTAGSYGFAAAGRAAGRIEAALDELAAGPAPEAWREIDRALAALRAEAA